MRYFAIFALGAVLATVLPTFAAPVDLWQAERASGPAAELQTRDVDGKAVYQGPTGMGARDLQDGHYITKRLLQTLALKGLRKPGVAKVAITGLQKAAAGAHKVVDASGRLRVGFIQKSTPYAHGAIDGGSRLLEKGLRRLGRLPKATAKRGELPESAAESRAVSDMANIGTPSRDESLAMTTRD
ncbi:hypothetical protein BC835DRAFT_1414052 [Cytidiella melzeri]|nr:hypothetical protein BC835DRAFT_1414052 [Cytidiella melzeri]